MDDFSIEISYDWDSPMKSHELWTPPTSQVPWEAPKAVAAVETEVAEAALRPEGFGRKSKA